MVNFVTPCKQTRQSIIFLSTKKEQKLSIFPGKSLITFIFCQVTSKETVDTIRYQERHIFQADMRIMGSTRTPSSKNVNYTSRKKKNVNYTNP
jgi:hypothetical protein